MQKLVQVLLLLVCVVATAGLARDRFLGGRQLAPVIPDNNTTLDEALSLAQISADSVMLIVVDHRCAACRARHAEIKRMVDMAVSLSHEVVVVALGPSEQDPVYYSLIAPDSLIVPDPDGSIVRKLGVRSVPAVVIARGGRSVFASTPSKLLWPDWTVLEMALTS